MTNPYLRALLDMPDEPGAPRETLHTYRIRGTIAGIPVDLTIEHSVPAVEQRAPTTEQRPPVVEPEPTPDPIKSDVRTHITAERIADVLEIRRTSANALVREGIIAGERVPDPSKQGRYKYSWVAPVDHVVGYIQTAVAPDVRERYMNRLRMETERGMKTEETHGTTNTA